MSLIKNQKMHKKIVKKLIKINKKVEN